MTYLKKDKIYQAKQKLRETLSFEKLKEMPKYRNLTKDNYGTLIDNIEVLTFLILESYIFIQNNTS